MEPTIYNKPSIYKGAGIYNTGAEGGGGGGGGDVPEGITIYNELYTKTNNLIGRLNLSGVTVDTTKNFEIEIWCNLYVEDISAASVFDFFVFSWTGYSNICGFQGSWGQNNEIKIWPTYRPSGTRNYTNVTFPCKINHLKYKSENQKISIVAYTDDEGIKTSELNGGTNVANTINIDGIFASSNLPAGKNFFCSFFRATIKNNDSEIIGDFVPAYNSNGAYRYNNGVWDKITKNFYSSYNGDNDNLIGLR